MVWLCAVVSGRHARVTRALLLTSLLGAVVYSGCTTNHDALARQPKAGSSAGGSAGAMGVGAFGNTGNDTSIGGRRNPDEEILGDDVLTIVNGVVDAESVALCFARLDEDGAARELVGSPGQALAYGASLVLTEIAGLDVASDTIQPWLLAGELSLVDDLDCEAAVALAEEEEAKVTPVGFAEGAGGAGGESDSGSGGVATAGAAAGGAAGQAGEPEPPLEMPRLRARPVAAIPAGSLNIGRSILMVLSGCLGGAAYRDTVATAACGQEYAPDSPTLEPVVVTLSRALSFGAVGLQGVQGSLSVDSIDVRVSGEDNAVALTFASDITFGAIAPRPADTRFPASELGVTQRDYGLQAVGDAGVLFQQAWADIRAGSGIDEIVDSRTYTAVFVGPNPNLLKAGWWNPPTFVLVDNDPTRE